MIEYPTSSSFHLVLMIIGVFFFLAAFLNLDTRRQWLIFTIIGSVLAIIGLFMYVTDTTLSDWKEQVMIEIENTPCEDLSASYEYYNKYSTDIGEKIKSKYIFECVADKEDSKILLEMMR